MLDPNTLPDPSTYLHIDALFAWVGDWMNANKITTGLVVMLLVAVAKKTKWKGDDAAAGLLQSIILRGKKPKL